MDKMEITVLEDGQLQITTDKISMKNHCSADELLNMVEKLMGGQRETEHKRQGHGKNHLHNHNHGKVWHKH